jgi:hypothetical protein
VGGVINHDEGLVTLGHTDLIALNALAEPLPSTVRILIFDGGVMSGRELLKEASCRHRLRIG